MVKLVAPTEEFNRKFVELHSKHKMRIHAHGNILHGAAVCLCLYFHKQQVEKWAWLAHVQVPHFNCNRTCTSKHGTHTHLESTRKYYDTACFAAMLHTHHHLIQIQTRTNTHARHRSLSLSLAVWFLLFSRLFHLYSRVLLRSLHAILGVNRISSVVWTLNRITCAYSSSTC